MNKEEKLREKVKAAQLNGSRVVFPEHWNDLSIHNMSSDQILDEVEKSIDQQIELETQVRNGMPFEEALKKMFNDTKI